MTTTNHSEHELALSQASNLPASNSPAHIYESKKPEIEPKAVQDALDRLVIAVQSAAKDNIQHGLFHLPSNDHDALWMACNVLQKSGAFPQYQFTFYHQGMGEGTNTCAVAFLNPPKLDREIN
jgi:hypothetical protein